MQEKGETVTKVWIFGGLKNWVLALSLCLLASCGGSGGSSSPTGEGSGDPVTNEPVSVYRHPKFDVTVTHDLVYGQGLSHSGWNSSDASQVDLRLDLYVPNNQQSKRPLLVFVHGGGFRTGDKLEGAGVYFPTYFAERGFVAASINYRLMDDYGTLPKAIEQYVDAQTSLSDYKKNQHKAMYPATRDARAALRYLAARAEELRIDTKQIHVIGSSAGALIAAALAVIEPTAFTSELTPEQDATLASTHLEQTVNIASAVSFWGSPAVVELYHQVYNESPWNSEDAPIAIVHGTEDETIAFSEAEKLRDYYQASGAYFEFYALEGAPHSGWSYTYQGTSLDDLAFDFIVRNASIQVIEN
jgi:acetyl esterase/lipase